MPERDARAIRQHSTPDSQLKAAKAKGTILTELKRIERTDLLILDDFGIHPFDAAARSSLMDIIEYL